MFEYNVLLEEDSDSDALLIKVHLRSDTRFLVTHVETLAGACEALGNSSAFHVVILDLNLPDSMGLSTFGSLHDRFPEIPVVILSGQDDEEVAIGICCSRQLPDSVPLHFLATTSRCCL
jgi:DNA-binding NtrC family response regulator